MARLTTCWGQFVENLVEPGAIRLFQERGIEVQETARRMQGLDEEASLFLGAI